MNKRALVVGYGSILITPPTRQAVLALQAEGFRVTILQLDSTGVHSETSIENVDVVLCPRISYGSIFRSTLQFLLFRRLARKLLSKLKPDVVITAAPHDAAALPSHSRNNTPRYIAAILDIPVYQDAGYLDRGIFMLSWRRMKEADIVWASDIYKAQLAQDMGQLPSLPLVCHNCPTLDYLPEPTWPRDPWLRTELIRQGAPLGPAGGSILLRAGAVGECCGIEETLRGMAQLPSDFVFVMLGRPTDEYKIHLQNQIEQLGLKRRAFLWDRPSDDMWKKALQGADIGHLIHGPFPPGRMTRLYELNSSLSNNRLFQYMAAGLPIISYDDPRMSDIYREVPCFKIARLAHLKEDIQQAWKELGDDVNMRRYLGAAGRKWHLKKYHWEYQFAPVLDRIKA